MAVLAGAAALVVSTGSAFADPSGQPSAPQLHPVAARTGASTTAGPWTQVGSYSQPTLTSGQGLAFVQRATGQSVIYRGNASIPFRLYLQGWQHIGDPGAWRGYVVDAYQGASTGTSKLFEITTPTGQRIDLLHPLASREQYNNSFATISPDGKWLVSGEWNDMTRLLVFRMPPLTSGMASSGTLRLAGTIALDHVVRNVQGCDFVTAQQLLCSSDEGDTDLFGVSRPLLQVDLATALGPNTSGTVTALGGLPQVSICSGTFETEGIGYAAPNDLRVEMIPPSPCSISTTVYQFRRS